MNDLEYVNPIPDEINIGEYLIYTDYIKVVGNTTVNEQATVSGDTAVTNRCIKNTVVTLGGRLAIDTDFKLFLLYAENILRNSTSVTFQYSGMSFNSAILRSYSAENKNNEITDIKLIFSTSNISAVNENEVDENASEN